MPILKQTKKLKKRSKLSISFNNSHPTLTIPDSQKLSKWLNMAAQNEEYHIGRLSYTFLTDEELHKINVQFLNHDTYTDIITFDYNRDKLIIGEIYISLDRVEENAKTSQISYNQEVKRIIIHGFLHLMAYNDKNPDDKKEMTTKEDYYLSLQP